MIKHPIKPVFDANSKVLVLGSFPSVKSREQTFFYGHPQNRFWKVLSAVFGREEPRTVEQKREFLLSVGVAVWDVVGECEIIGSADSTIKNVVVPNDVNAILDNAPVKKIYLNGKTAYKLYNLYLKDKTGIEATCLPSTSPANAAWTLNKLIAEWSVVKNS